MDDTKTTTPSPSSAATAAGYDAARDKANAPAAASTSTSNSTSSVRLLIKSSNQQYEDMNIESDLCWTVQKLKKQLSLVYPGKPAINDQKLIYSGKLLDDTQKLSEVIRSYKDVYQQHHIFHLVCANKNITKVYKNTNATPKDTKTTTARQDTNSNDNELRQRHVGAAATAGVVAGGANAAQFPYQQQQMPFSQQLANATSPWLPFVQPPQLQNQYNQMPTTETTPNAISSHLEFQQQQVLLYNAWIQQCYAAYMQQMMQRASGNGSAAQPQMPPFLQGFPQFPNNVSVPPVVAPQTVPVTADTAAAGPAQPNEVAAAAAAVQQPAARQADGPNFPNIQEEPEMRDWLDSFFSFTRLAIFVTVLYFNSSPLRCLLVVIIASVIYLYHIGVLRRRRERNNNNINRNNNAGNDDVAFAAVQQIQRMMDAAVERNDNPQADADVAPIAAQDAAANNAAHPAAAAGAAAAGPPAGADADAPESAGAVQANAATAAEAVAVEPANANNSVISIVRTLVITFFTSLLPEAPAL